jgi:hypothetical protein
MLTHDYASVIRLSVHLGTEGHMNASPQRAAVSIPACKEEVAIGTESEAARALTRNWRR